MRLESVLRKGKEREFGKPTISSRKLNKNLLTMGRASKGGNYMLLCQSTYIRTRFTETSLISERFTNVNSNTKIDCWIYSVKGAAEQVR